MTKNSLHALFDLTGRSAIVTGGTRGIGLAIAEGLVECGANVVVASRKADGCATAAEKLQALGGGQAVGVPTHLGDLDAIDRLVDATVDDGDADALSHGGVPRAVCATSRNSIPVAANLLEEFLRTL